MNNLLKSSTLGVALLTALLPLACCWGPTLLAGVAVFSGSVTQLAWLHPYEPYLYSISFFALGYSHFNSYKQSKKDEVGCETCAGDSEAGIKAKKYSKIALWMATGLVIAMFLVNQFPELFI